MQLQNPEKYYIGKSENNDQRILNHSQCNEKSAKFVQHYGGVKSVLEPITPPDNNLSNWEKDETLARMIKHGFNNVRGWEFTSTTNLDKGELDMVKVSIMGLGDRCRKCGHSGHFAQGCVSEKATWLKNLDMCYPSVNSIKTSTDVMNSLLDENSTETMSDFNSINIITEISPNGKAKCQICKEPIYKDSVRIGVPYEFKGQPSTKWHHQTCYSCPNKKQKTASVLKKTQKVKQCYRCGRSGHYAGDCYATKDVDGDIIYDSDSDDDQCYRCGRSGHYAADCYATKDVNGFYIRD